MNIGEFEEYIKGKYGNVIDGVLNTNGTREGILLGFKAGVIQATRDAVAAEIATYNFSAAPAAPAKFVIDCNGDGTIPANMRQNINIMALWFKQGEKAIALDIWTMIKAAATAPQITAIRSHATDNGITLP